MWLTFQHAWTQTSPSLHRDRRPLWSTSAESLPYTLIIVWLGLHAHLFHRNVCRSRSFQLHSHSLQLHKHTNAHHLYRNQPIQGRITNTKPPSLLLVPELLVILQKWMSRTCLLLQCVFLESCSTLKAKPKTVPLAPHMLIPWRDC
jgi:hypothetical protein